MARKRRGRPVHGWLVLDKPVGVSSACAVAAVRRQFDAEKAGHGGTLDPLASGVLPIALGEATKTVAWTMACRKTYRFTVRWGEARETDDAEGAITAISDHRPSRDEISAALPDFIGEIRQRPPAYSALKVAGRRAYELIGLPDPDHAEFEAEVGKGTYIRALGRDLALSLGTHGHISALRRTRVGPFHEAHAISLDKLPTLGHSPAPFEHLLPVETALDDIPALALTEAEAARLRCGQAVLPLRPSDRAFMLELGNGQRIRATCGTKLVALAEIADGALRAVRVLNL